MRLVWSAVIALGLAGVAYANGDEKSRAKELTASEIEALKDLAQRILLSEELPQDPELERLKKAAAQEKEEEMKGLPERISKLEKAQAAGAQTWDASKMLSFATADGNFTAKIGGRIYFIYRHIFDRDDSSGGSVDTMGLDTARFDLSGTFFKHFLYKIEGEAQSTSTSGSFRMKDTYMGWSGVPWFSVQAGQMKTPWSQEETTSSRFIDFAERSLLNRLAPAHDVGLLFKGDFMEKMFEWNLGVFNGALGRDAGRNAVDVNDEKDVVGRLFISPLKNSGIKAVETMRLGFDFTVGDRDTTATGAGITTGDLGGVTVNPFAGTAPASDGRQTRMLFNFAWAYGPAAIQAEYGIVKTELIDTAAESDFEMTGAYLQGTYILTGETKVLGNRIKPNANFSPMDGTWGAWELAARFAMLDTSDGEDAGVVAATANQETREVTVGINWWMAPNVVLRINWEHFMFDEDLVVGSGDSAEDTQDVFYVRWQIDF